MSIDLGTLGVIGRLNGLAALSTQPDNFKPLTDLRIDTEACVISDNIVYDNGKTRPWSGGDYACPIVTAVAQNGDGYLVATEYLTEALTDLEQAYVVIPGPSSNGNPYIYLAFRQVVENGNRRIAVGEDIVIENGVWHSAH